MVNVKRVLVSLIVILFILDSMLKSPDKFPKFVDTKSTILVKRFLCQIEEHTIDRTVDNLRI